MFDLQRYMKYLIEHELTERQFLFCYCTQKAYKDQSIYRVMGDFTKALGVMQDGRKRFMLDTERTDLITKGYITCEGDGTKASHYHVTDKWLDEFVTEYEAGQQLIAAYPSFIQINGVNVPLKTTDRAVIRSTYTDRIHGDRRKHERVIEALEYGVKHGLVNMNLEKFVLSEFWEDLIEKMVQEHHTTTRRDVVNENEF